MRFRLAGGLLVLLAVGNGQMLQARWNAGPARFADMPASADGAITGAVTDAATGGPVAGAIVTLEQRRSGRRVQSYVQMTTPRGRFAFLTVASRIPASEWSLRSFVVGGRDVLDVPLEIGPAGDVTGAVATFTDRHSELSGSVRNASNMPALEGFVLVFPSDRAFWRPASRRIQFTRPGIEGRFAFRDLPAGDYWIAAVPDVDASDLSDVSFMERLVAAAMTVHLEEGEQKTQDVRVVK